MQIQNANYLNNATHVTLLILNVTEDLEVQFQSDMKTIFIILFLSLFILLTIFGNILVMLAFIVDKRLRTQSNFFLLNLAICDFFIGAFTSPLYVPYMLTGKWMLGKHLCKLWLVADYTMCTASALNVTLISYDRFISVTKAVLYRSSQKNHSEAFLKITAVWIMSFLLYSPSILVGKGDNIENVCRMGLFDTWYFNLITSVFDFFLPLISISFFNLSIYWNITKRKMKKRQSTISISTGEKSSVKPFIIATNQVLASVDGVKDISTQRWKREDKVIRLGVACKRNSSLQADQISRMPSNYNICVIKLSRDKNVAKSLAVLVLVFAVCWMPYSLVIIISTACPYDCGASYWYYVTVWMLYLNSAINPILYPMCHKSFRKAFSLLWQLCLKLLTV
ncbi:histamine H3 receptor-like [Lithobates pipiens]